MQLYYTIWGNTEKIKGWTAKIENLEGEKKTAESQVATNKQLFAKLIVALNDKMESVNNIFDNKLDTMVQIGGKYNLYKKKYLKYKNKYLSLRNKKESTSD